MKQQTLLAVFLLLALACTTNARSSYYKLYGYCAASYGDYNNEGKALVYEKCDEDNPNQIWMDFQAGGETFYSYVNKGTGLASDARDWKGSSFKSGRKANEHNHVATYILSDRSSQKWTAIPVPGTDDTFLAKNAENGLCFTALNSKPPIYIGLEKCNVKNKSQQLLVIPADPEIGSNGKNENHKKNPTKKHKPDNRKNADPREFETDNEDDAY